MKFETSLFLTCCRSGAAELYIKCVEPADDVGDVVVCSAANVLMPRNVPVRPPARSTIILCVRFGAGCTVLLDIVPTPVP